jgi:hypothetical protein
MKYLLALLLVSSMSQASDLMLELGLTQSFYEGEHDPASVSSDDMIPKLGYIARAGWGDFPVYAVLSYESTENSLRGQNVSNPDVLTFGAGTKVELGKFSIFLEAGYADVTTNANNTGGYDVVEEVVYTHLVSRHYVPGRPIPVDTRQGAYESSYELDSGPFARIGVGYQLWPHVRLTGSYRFLKVDSQMAIWDTERRANGNGYWREDGQADFNAFEVSLLWTY